MARRYAAAGGYTGPLSALIGGASAGWQGAQTQEQARQAAVRKAALDASLKQQQQDADYRRAVTVAQVGADSRQSIAGGFVDPASGQWVPGRNVSQAAQVQNTADYHDGLLGLRAGEDVGTGKAPAVSLDLGLNAFGRPGLAAPPPDDPSALLGPAALAKIGAANAGAGRAQAQTAAIGNKDASNFENTVGLLPVGQQPQFVADWNRRNGSDYGVPGANAPMPDGVSGPPPMVLPYGPNALQAGTLAQRVAQARLTGIKADDQPALDGSQIVLRGQQGAALTTNAGANAYRASVYGQVAPVMANAAASRAQTYATDDPIRAGAVAQNADTASGGLTLRQGQAGAAGAKTYDALKSKAQGLIATYDQQKQAIIQGAIDPKTGKSRALSPGEQDLVDRADTNIQKQQHVIRAYDRGVSPVTGAPLPGAAVTPTVSGAVTPGLAYFTSRDGQSCNGVQCGEAVSNSLRADGIGITATEARNRAQRNPSLRVRPDANGNYPPGTVLYFPPTNGIVDRSGTNQHYVRVLANGHVGESTISGGGGTRHYRTDRTPAQVAREHGAQPLAFDPRAAAGLNSRINSASGSAHSRPAVRTAPGISAVPGAPQDPLGDPMDTPHHSALQPRHHQTGQFVRPQAIRAKTGRTFTYTVSK